MTGLCSFHSGGLCERFLEYTSSERNKLSSVSKTDHVANMGLGSSEISLVIELQSIASLDKHVNR